MKSYLQHLRSAIGATFILALVCCGIYPVVVWAIGSALFHEKANGSLIIDAHGVVRGSRLVGQSFSAPQYFHPRPSAAGNGYDATSSGGSNLGPTSQKLRDVIKERIDQYRKVNGLTTDTPVPADAVTASGSGLDPHISLLNAEMQAQRVAKARGIEERKVHELIRANTDRASLGFLGENGVNVLMLNLALDTLR